MWLSRAVAVGRELNGACCTDVAVGSSWLLVNAAQATYVRVPAAARLACAQLGLPCGTGMREGIHGACHAILNVLPLYLPCNPTDVGTECDHPYDTR